MAAGFEGVLGQEAAVAALTRTVRRGGGAGSTLIVGPEGVGRFLLGLKTAGMVLAPAGGAAAARVAAMQHADLQVLDSEAGIPKQGIDGVREVLKRVARKPVEAERQVLLVRDADRLSVAALNALLKTLEEPPADACVLVVAEGPEFLPETVVSRCRTVRAAPLRAEAMGAALARLGLDPALVEVAEGSPGRAAYLAAECVLPAADKLLEILAGGREDPLADAERMVRRKSEETSKEQRRRLGETLRVVAIRLRTRLPDSEIDLRCVLEALGSLAGNANPGIVFAELVLQSWKNRRPQRIRG